MSKAMTKTQKTINLVAKLDGTLKPGELVAKIQSMCQFNTERAARTYLHNARRDLKSGKAKPTSEVVKAPKGRKELTQAQKDAKNAARRAQRAAAKQGVVKIEEAA